MADLGKLQVPKVSQWFYFKQPSYITMRDCHHVIKAVISNTYLLMLVCKCPNKNCFYSTAEKKKIVCF